jgi:hypothetical protein
MASADVDALEIIEPGWILQQISDASAEIDARLAKRYAVPFSNSSPPLAILRWLTAIVTPLCYFKRGVNPSDAQFAQILKAAERAEAAIKEAADSNTGLYELPLRADSAAGGITRGFPRGYSEASPYVGFTIQRAAAWEEDSSGVGTSR